MSQPGISTTRKRAMDLPSLLFWKLHFKYAGGAGFLIHVSRSQWRLK
jgi:hypothetical protein